MAANSASYEDGVGRNLAKKFELQAYDLRAYLKKFRDETGEEAISDGFGFLTESDEVRNAYIEYSTTAAGAMKAVHQHLDTLAEALRQVNKNTEVTDGDVAVLFGKSTGAQG
ncbi:hypothetical protein [Streptomyces sp. NPDC046859]|uniref:hypothetical protein n=1 Tax=Streptomyces sp. NPDC046859 TaxID=3155734 RepID=UPI0033FE18ED